MSNPHYTTHDPYLSSFLCYRGSTLADCERIGPKTVEFGFLTGADLHDLLRLYWSGQPTPVVPARLFGCLRRLKSMSINR